MSFKRAERTREKEPTSLEQGNFALNGSWISKADPSERGPLYRFIAELVRIRRLGHASPAQVAQHIRDSHFAEAFGELDQWATLTDPDWSFAWCRTSADAAVKYCDNKLT